MHTARTFVAIATLLLPAASSAQGTRAESPPRPPESETPLTGVAARSQVSYERGLRLYDDDHYEEALQAFRESFEIYASPNPRLYIARSLRELGRLGEAVREYELTIQRGDETARVERRYALTRDAARTELAALSPRIGRLTLTVAGAPAGARIRVAGVELTEAQRATPIAVNPGTLEIVAEADGYETATSQVEVSPGGTASASVTMRPRGASVAAGGDNGSLLRTLGFVSLGVGAVGLIGFGAFTAMANGTYQSLVMQCGDVPCPPSQRDAIAAGRSQETLAGVGLGIGIVGVVAGTTLLIVSATRGSAARPAVTVGFTGNGLSLGGAF